MSRILLLLSMVLLLASAWFVYSQGILGQIFNPTAVVLRAEQDIPESYRVQFSMIRAVEIPVADLPPGAIAFPRGADEAQIGEVLAAGRALSPIAQDGVLSGRNFGRSPEVWQLRTMAAFNPGDPVETSDIEALLSDTPDADAMSFGSREEAEGYVQSRAGMRATVVLEPGAIVKRDDVTSGDGGLVYALETLIDLASGSTLSAADVRAVTLPSTEIPRGAIAFPSRSGADIFVTASQSLALAADIPAGTILDATMLRPGATRVLRDGLDPDAPPPATLAELLEAQTQEPFGVKMINVAAANPDLTVEPSIPLVGAAPMEDDTMDLWVETGTTQGTFGTISLRRFVSGIRIQKVVDPELVLAQMQRQDLESAEEQSGATAPDETLPAPDARGIFYWANITRAGGLAVEEAKEDGRLIFAMSSRTPVSDFLGNGVLCRDDYCSVSVSASQNLASVRTVIEQFRGQEQSAVEDQIALAPFSVLDGVSMEIEGRMHAEGYTTFEDVARWEDAQLQIIEFQLGVSRTLVLYIREQARTIVNMPTAARQQLSIAATPTE